MMRWLAIALAVAACGKDLHHGVDALPADVATDTLGPDNERPPNAVALTITRIGAPVPGVAVMFQAADGSLVHASLTNDKGIAWAVMESGGFVTAIESKGAGLDELTTFSAVQAGESLELAFDPTGPLGESPAVLGIPADAGAGSYQVYTSCGGPFGADPSAPAVVQLVGCNGVADIVVVSEDGDTAPLHSIYAPSVTVPTEAIQPLNVIGQYGSFVTTSFAYSNVPSAITFVATYHVFANTHGRVYERTAGEVVSGGSAITFIALPNASPMSLVGTTLMSADVGTQIVYESRASSPSYVLDVGAALVPPFATQPTFDVASKTLTWTERTATVQPDLVRTRVRLYRDDIPSGRAWSWRMITPRNGTSVRYPTLPVYGFDFNPAAGDIATIDELTTADVPGGYAAARPVGFGDLTRLVIGTTERMVVQQLNTSEL